MKECRKCKYITVDADGPTPEARYFWYACKAKKGYDNLKSFPFKRTRCKYFVKSQERWTSTIVGLLLREAVKETIKERM